MLLNMYASRSELIPDDFRQKMSEFLKENVKSLCL